MKFHEGEEHLTLHCQKCTEPDHIIDLGSLMDDSGNGTEHLVFTDTSASLNTVIINKDESDSPHLLIGQHSIMDCFIPTDETTIPLPEQSIHAISWSPPHSTL